MSFKADIDTYFILVAGVAGLGLFGFSLSSFKHLQKNCTNSFIRRGLTIVMTIGAILTTMSICYMLCVKPWSKKPRCYSGEDGLDMVNTYMIAMGIISIGLVSLLILMIISYNKHKAECKRKDLTFNLYFMLAMGVVGIVITSGVLIHDTYSNYNDVEDDEEDDETVGPDFSQMNWRPNL
tara:strand:+ start:152 stop:691 length:540 start_codon:yes stop_codon:yes gene_type:complete